MGSWTETCGISNMPVNDGDEVVLIYLKQNQFRKSDREASRGVYPGHFYAPATLPLYGTYADYGSVDVSEGPENDAGRISIRNVIKWMKWDLIKEAMIERWNVHYDDDFKNGAEPNEKNWEIKSEQMNIELDQNQFHDAAERGRIFVAGYDGNACALTPMIILKEVWGYVISREISHWPSNSKIQKSILEGIECIDAVRDRKTREAEAQKKLEALRAASEERISWEDIPEEIKEDMTLGLRGGLGTQRDKIFDWLFASGQEFNFHECHNLFDTFIKSDVEDMAFSRAVCEVLYASVFVQDNRRTWHPTTGSGSQQSNYQGSIDFHKRMLEIAEQKRKENGRDEDY